MDNKQPIQTEIPEVDNGWWESVLSDDSKDSYAQKPPKDKGFREKQEKTFDWIQARELFKNDQVIQLVITGCNKGGLLIEKGGIHGFIPGSHLIGLDQQLSSEEKEKFLATYIGRKMSLKVIECLPEEGRLVLSERAAQTEPGKRTQLMSDLNPGQKTSGVVTNITEFGVFVDIGGVEGLIHLSELSWGRVYHPTQILKIGQRIEVLILEIKPERCRVALSLKRLAPNPWELVEAKYLNNQVVPAVITSSTSFGVFARLEDGLEGLIHISEIPNSPGKSISSRLQPGQKVITRIMKVDISRQRLSLSLNIDQSENK